MPKVRDVREGVEGADRPHDVSELPIGGSAHVVPTAVDVDPDGHLWISTSPLAIDHGRRMGRIHVSRKSETEYDVTIPWTVRFRWPRPRDTDIAGGGVKATTITHYPLPWSRAVWWATQRCRPLGFLEDWLSQRTRGPGYVLTAGAWATVFGLTVLFTAPAQIVTFMLVWGAVNIPPIHSAIEALWTKDSGRFAQPGRYFRPYEREQLRNEDPRLRFVVPAPDVLPSNLYYKTRGSKPKTTVREKVRGFFDDMFSERSTVPQFSLTMGVTGFGFTMKHLVGTPVFDPVPILIGSWAISQVSTVHSVYEAVQMKAHGATWAQAIKRILRPTSFPRPEKGTRFGSSVDHHAEYASPIVSAALAPAVAARAVPDVAGPAFEENVTPEPQGRRSLTRVATAPCREIGPVLARRPVAHAPQAAARDLDL